MRVGIGEDEGGGEGKGEGEGTSESEDKKSSKTIIPSRSSNERVEVGRSLVSV